MFSGALKELKWHWSWISPTRGIHGTHGIRRRRTRIPATERKINVYERLSPRDKSYRFYSRRSNYIFYSPRRLG